jgi:redox-sensitive bicupin YhaK (pirin superfamily)
VAIGESRIPTQRMAILANHDLADGVLIEAAEDAQVLLVAGRPLHEPIAQHGPFVMNTQAEILQTLSDFHAGRLA